MSPRVKRRILDAFAVDAADVDAALRDLRARLEPEHGVGFAFVDLVEVR